MKRTQSKLPALPLTSRQKKVYDAQDEILSALKKHARFPFVLSGGTALSRFYFHHRFSEDLDFFFTGYEFSFETIIETVNALRKSGLFFDLVGKTDQPGRLKIAAYVASSPPHVKIDFLEDHLSGMWPSEKRTSESGLVFEVDSPDQIYYRKLYSILEQKHRLEKVMREKDLVDLYILHTYHCPMEKTVAFYRKNHISFDTEGLMMVLDGLKKGDVEETYRREFRKISARLVKEGLNR